ncbi:MAG: TlpA family protein disulfide reductase [Lachnospiraceae bacterium]|nr:TlpA family protein disulfide reductase [Lachnospiraceae bacterium]
MRCKKRKILLYLCLVSMLMLSGCGEGQSNTSQSSTSKDGTSQNKTDVSDTETKATAESYHELSEGEMAPEFTASLADGSTFTLSEQEGKVVLLNFWATWCGPCVGEMPAFEKLYTEYGDKISILAVNCMEDAQTVDRFISDNGYTFPIAYDEKGDILTKYPSDGIPYTLVIDGNGMIKNIYLGALDAEQQYEEYKSAIDAVLGQ